MPLTHIFPIDINMIEFEKTGFPGYPESKLLATVQFGSTLHHLEAIAVTEREDGEQVADDAEHEALLSDLSDALGEGGAFHTATINGREYALFLSPFRM